MPISSNVLNPKTSYVECYRQWVEVIGLSIGSVVTWWPKADDWVVQKKGYAGSEKCKCLEILTENVKVEHS